MDRKTITAGKVFFLLTVLTAAMGGGAGYWERISPEDLLKTGLLTAVFFLIAAFFMQLNDIALLNSIKNTAVVIGGYILSLVLVMASPVYELFHFWFLGPVLIGLMIHPLLGISFHFILSADLCILSGYGMEYFFYYFIIGSLLIFLTPYMKKPLTFFYSLIIGLSMNVTLSFLLTFFVPDMALSIPLSVLSTAFVMLAAVGIFCGLNRLMPLLSGKRTKEDTAGKSITCEDLVKEDNELLCRLRLYSRKRYIHSIMVGEISARAAEALGADSLTARAGGLYHEIGRIEGKDYIAQGLRLARENRFPEKVTDIIKQHNSRIEKPKSVEAAIVMLTDSILSTLDYLEKKQRDKETDPLDVVEQVLEIRLAKDTLSESGMSVRQFQDLKSFFVKNCF